VACLVALAVAPAAHATFPGQNGKLAFDRRPFSGDARTWTVDPDGSDLAPLGGECAQYQYLPRWSPDGSKVLYDCDSSEVRLVNADGSEDQFVQDYGPITALAWSPDARYFLHSVGNLGDEDYFYDTYVAPAPGHSGGWTYLSDRQQHDLDWSPDGRSIALNAADDGDIWTISPDATGLTNVTNTPGAGEGWPSWAPDNAKLAFVKPDAAGWSQIYTIEPDGSGLAQVTTGATHKSEPVWSPDGTKIAFAARLDGQTFTDLYTMNSDGTNVFRVTSTPESDENPDWQPIPINAYPRPKGASPTRVSLVPAYEPCTSPDRTHGPPLAFPSCTPTQEAGELTVGSPDANGRPAKSVSYLRINPLRGDPLTPADEADVRMRADVTDVRLRSDLSDYTGSLEVRVTLQVTDKDNTPHPGGPGAATVQAFTHSQPISCAATVDASVGSTCDLDTTVEALVPGAVKELTRAIWELGAIRVHDGAGNLFMTQGVFVP
jgi:hypothetical protein